MDQIIDNSHTDKLLYSGYEFIGKIHDHNFNIIKKQNGEKYYLDIFNSVENTNDKYFILLDSDIDKKKLQKIAKRYTNQPTMEDPDLNKIHLVKYQMFKMEKHLSYTSPECNDDNEYGWHMIMKILGTVDKSDIGLFEKSLLYCEYFNKSFIKQMTAHYNNPDDMTTVVETKYSNSIIEFTYVEENGLMFVLFYFKGDSVNDIPVDIKKAIDKYGIYDVDKK